MSYRVTLLPGDGIGPEVTAAMVQVVAATGVEIAWDEHITGAQAVEETGYPLPPDVFASLRKNRLGIKGPITTPVAKGFQSVNVQLRKTLNLYANLRPARSLPGVTSRFVDVDLVVVRENTEDLYAGVEHQITRGVVESVKVITWDACRNIADFAFSYARRLGRRKVTAVHKANIMKLSDGLFLSACEKVAKKYPDIEYGDVIVDALCMKLVTNPHQFDVLVCENLYGDIVSDLCAGLVGGLGLVPGANMGRNMALFETVHGSAPDIAGKGIANPVAMILTAELLLRHIEETTAAVRLEEGVHRTLAEGKHLTPDIGGSSSTEEMTAAIIDNMPKQRRRAGVRR